MVEMAVVMMVEMVAQVQVHLVLNMLQLLIIMAH